MAIKKIDKDFYTFAELEENLIENGEDILSRYFYEGKKKNSPDIELSEEEIKCLANYAHHLQETKKIYGEKIIQSKGFNFSYNKELGDYFILAGDSLQTFLQYFRMHIQDGD